MNQRIASFVKKHKVLRISLYVIIIVITITAFLQFADKIKFTSYSSEMQTLFANVSNKSGGSENWQYVKSCGAEYNGWSNPTFCRNTIYMYKKITNIQDLNSLYAKYYNVAHSISGADAGNYKYIDPNSQHVNAEETIVSKNGMEYRFGLVLISLNLESYVEGNGYLYEGHSSLSDFPFDSKGVTNSMNGVNAFMVLSQRNQAYQSWYGSHYSGNRDYKIARSDMYSVFTGW